MGEEEKGEQNSNGRAKEDRNQLGWLREYFLSSKIQPQGQSLSERNKWNQITCSAILEMMIRDWYREQHQASDKLKIMNVLLKILKFRLAFIFCN